MRRSPSYVHAPRTAQGGATLIELLVGITIGLMTIAVALGALLVSRGVSGTVSDASLMQQQAAHALRVIGQQVRQAGSIRLNLAFGKDAAATIDPADPVAFETDFDRAQGSISGDDAFALRVGYQNYQEQVVAGTAAQSLLRDCLGNQPSATVIESNFRLVKANDAATGELQCVGADNAAGTIIANVADFQVRYLLQAADAAGTATVRSVQAADAAVNWPAVVGVQVCFEVVGEENIDTAGATYRNCSWQAGQAEAAMGNRMRMVFRNTFQLRSQGAPR